MGVGGGLLVLGLKLILAFVFGFLWALVPLAISAWVPNRYVTLIAPFVLYQCMWALLSGTPFNPVGLLRCDMGNMDLTYFGALGIQFAYIAIACVLFWFGLKRRVNNA